MSPQTLHARVSIATPGPFVTGEGKRSCGLFINLTSLSGECCKNNPESAAARWMLSYYFIKVTGDCPPEIVQT